MFNDFTLWLIGGLLAGAISTTLIAWWREDPAPFDYGDGWGER